jgi:hypothetical protein
LEEKQGNDSGKRSTENELLLDPNLVAERFPRAHWGYNCLTGIGREPIATEWLSES